LFRSGRGDSALRAGLTCAPCAVVFGLFGYWWRRLPERAHHVLPPAGCAAAGLGYLALALVVRSGGSGGWLVAHPLVRVPLQPAADASGLLTTTIQLGQAIGVATFGSLFLTLDAPPGAA